MATDPIKMANLTRSLLTAAQNNYIKIADKYFENAATFLISGNDCNR
jgi:hypothetical protein